MTHYTSLYWVCIFVQVYYKIARVFTNKIEMLSLSFQRGHLSELCLFLSFQRILVTCAKPFKTIHLYYILYIYAVSSGGREYILLFLKRVFDVAIDAQPT